MVCRSKERAEEARSKIVAEFAEADLPVLLGDCSLEADVRRVWAEFSGRERALHGLCCNAGALLNEKVLTSEGHEVTFAAHLLFGAYLLGKLAIDCLVSSGGRLVLVSSGGMYNHGFPEWEVAASLKGEYDGTAFRPMGLLVSCNRDVLTRGLFLGRQPRLQLHEARASTPSRALGSRTPQSEGSLSPSGLGEHRGCRQGVRRIQEPPGSDAHRMGRRGRHLLALRMRPR
jgi:hypothetical protein